MKHIIKNLILCTLLSICLAGCSSQDNRPSGSTEGTDVIQSEVNTEESNTTEKISELPADTESTTTESDTSVIETNTSTIEENISAVEDNKFKFHGFTIEVSESDKYSVEYSKSFVTIKFPEEVFVSLYPENIPSYVDYNSAVECEQYNAWHLNLTDGILYEKYAIDDKTNCNIYTFGERIPMGVTEFETIIPRQGYVVVFSSPEADIVFDMFCPYEWNIDDVHEMISQIDIHYQG